MNLVIVESPSKAKTIKKYLGKDFSVIASVGHIRDLVPKNNSIDVNNNFKMKWQIINGKEKQLKLIEDAIKKSDNIYLASDPDREGEAISWHILELLKKQLENKNVYRIVFYEVTKNAILNAIKNPREINLKLVDSYLVRRALDYLIGFNISPLLWYRNIGRSAGRVQSVAVRIIVDREKEIDNFKSEEYWTIDAECNKKNVNFLSKIYTFNNSKVQKMTFKNQSDVDKVLSVIKTPTTAIVSNIKEKNIIKQPLPPFTTSTLQQTASKKLFFSSKKTMALAQKLYEKGFITYMRTDSVNLSKDFIQILREYISNKFGNDFLPNKNNIYITKSKNAQEAHEAIRPTQLEEKLNLESDEKKLYDLIFKRTIACQMSNAEFLNITIELQEKNSTFTTSGTTCKFEGFKKIYNDDEESFEQKLPDLKIGDIVDILNLKTEQHFTQPPAHYNEASLIKKLEELGIGRPSTYASIISTIIERKYVDQKQNRSLIANNNGWVLTAYLMKYFNNLVDIDFTAKTETALDNILNGKTDKIKTLNNFWNSLEKMINESKNIKTTEIINEINKYINNHIFKENTDICPKCGKKLILKLSKYGSFIGCSNYPECNYIQNINTETKTEKKELDLGDNIFFKIGRFGGYVTDGKNNAPAKKYTLDTITLEIAKNLLENKNKIIEIGINPNNNKIINYHPTGRYGSYISCDKKNKSVKKQPSLEEAIQLLNEKNEK